MKVDVLNLKGNKRSGKLTTDEKNSCVQGFLHINPELLIRLEKARGLGRKGQTLTENTGKGKMRANVDIKAEKRDG